MELVLLNSGGLDSIAVAHKLHGSGFVLHSLYVDVGQINSAEAKKAAQVIADLYCVDHHVFDFPESFVVPIGKLKTPGVAFQACFVYLCGAIYSRMIDVQYIASGLKSDAATNDFNLHFLNYLKTSKLTPCPVPVRPLSEGEWTVKDTLDLVGLDKATLTYSCNISPACGVCPKCLARKEYGID